MSFLVRATEALKTRAYWDRQRNPRPVFTTACGDCGEVATYSWTHGFPELPLGWCYQFCESDGQESNRLHCPECVHDESTNPYPF